MGKYKITIQRLGYREANFEVEAADEGRAEELALEQAANYDFATAGETDSDYDVLSVERVADGELEDLIQKADENGDDPLGDLVHDLVSRPASDINNGGGETQAGYILSVLGWEEGMKAIREAVAETP